MREEIINVLEGMLLIDKLNIEVGQDLSEIGLTSLMLISLIVELENKLNFEFNDDDLLFDNLNTIEKIEACVKRNRPSF